MNELNINAQEITMTPAIANPVGKLMKDRVASVLANAHGATALALINEKGSIGKLAREVAAQGGVVGIIQHCANANYKPLVDWLAIKLNCAILVRSRGEYNMLPTILDMRIMDAESKGSAAGEKLSAKLRAIKSDIVEIQAQAEELYQAKRAKQEAEQLVNAN